MLAKARILSKLFGKSCRAPAFLPSVCVVTHDVALPSPAEGGWDSTDMSAQGQPTMTVNKRSLLQASLPQEISNMPITVATGPDHIVLRVQDPVKSVQWYSDTLGLQPVRLDEYQAGE